MPYTFRLKFAGLCGFVPDRPLEPGARLDKMDVLLVNTRHESAQGLYKRPEPHTPMLQFDMRNVPGVNGTMGDAKGLWDLADEDLRLYTRSRGGARWRDLDRGISVNGNLAGRSGDRPRAQEEEHNLCWVPAIDEVLPGAGEVHPDCLAERPNTGRVRARFRLRQGLLKTHDVGKYLDDYVVAQFVPPPAGRPAVTQALAHWVAVEITNLPDDEEIMLVSYSLSQGGEKRKLVLASAGDPEVEVEIRNLCCGYYFAGERDEAEAPDTDYDFEALYLLSRDFERLRNEHARLPVPVPVSYAHRRNGSFDRPVERGGVDPLRCTMGLYNPSSASLSPSEGGVVVRREPAKSPPPSPLPVSSSPGRRTSDEPYEGEEDYFRRLEDIMPMRRLQVALPPAGEFHPGVQLGFRIQEQNKGSLCWAAVAASIRAFYGGQRVSQCELVNDLIRPAVSCCPDNEPLECDQAFSTRQALEHLRHFYGVEEGPASLDMIRTEIGAGRPIACGVGRLQSTHALVLHGWSSAFGRPQVFVSDPQHRSLKVWDYDQFASNLNFQWHLTYYTKPGEGGVR